MGLIHEEQIITFLSVREVAFQAHIRVKHIVVIADDPVGPAGDVQTVFKWAYPVLFRVLQDLLSCHLLFQVENIEYRLIDPVKVAFRVWHASGLHSHSSMGQSFSFAVIVTEVKIRP